MPGTDEGDLLGQGLELCLDVLDACGERGDLLAQRSQTWLERVRQAPAVVLDDLPGFGQHVPSSLGDEEAELAQQSPQSVDRTDAVGQPARAQTVQGSDDLLSDSLDGDGPDLLVAEGLEQGVDVGAVRLVPHHVGSDVLGRKKDDHVAKLLDPARPVVG